jgi:XTP/dITP diphosphohydrolase
MDILIGTKNAYKATEMVSFLEDLSGVNIHLWQEFGKEMKVEEDQPSLRRNAEKKAIEISKFTDWYVLASDGGVDIPGLGKNWDILRNQRTVGENKTDLEKAEKLLELMISLTGDRRKACYKLALALAKKGELIWSAEQITDRGLIAENLFDSNIPQYRWMGHLWYYPEFKKVFNQLDAEQKNEVRKQGAEMKKVITEMINEIIKTNKN